MSNLLKWGMDHPLSKSKIFGEFPDESENSIISLSDVEMALDREYTPNINDRRFIGVDVARFGDDKTIFYEFIGNQTTRIKELFQRSTTEVTGELITFLKERDYFRKSVVYIDATGVGSGVYDLLVERQAEGIIDQSVDIVEVHNSFKCEDEEDNKVYLNLRAKLYFALSDELKNDLCLIKNDDNFDELTAITFKYSSHGKLQIESKEDFKKRTGLKSPDYSDAMTLANAARLNLVTTKRIIGGVTSELVESHAKLMEYILGNRKHLEFVIVASFTETFNALVLSIDTYKNQMSAIGELVIDNPKQLSLKEIYLHLSKLRNTLIVDRHEPIYYIDYNSLQFIMDSNVRYDINWFQLPKSIGNHWNIRDMIKTKTLSISEKCACLYQELLTSTVDNAGALITLLQAVCDQYLLDTSLLAYPEEEVGERRGYSLLEDLENHEQKFSLYDKEYMEL
jgi:hypothetical protein